MITKKEAEAAAKAQNERPGSPVKVFEAKIDEAITVAYRDDDWPVTIALGGVSIGIRKMFETEYAKRGWKTKIVYDQRDGDYLHIEP